MPRTVALRRFVLISLIVALFLAPGPVLLGRGPTASPGAAPLRGAPIVSSGAALLASARASLAAGGGPAAARPMAGNTTPTWTEQVPAVGRSPLMTYDAADGYVLAFMGLFSRPLNSTWIYAGSNWTQIPTNRSPPAPGAAAMAYDPADREVVLFGGWTSSDCLVHNCSKYNSTAYLYRSHPLNDTWTYRAGTWTELNRSRTHAPPARSMTSMAFDAADGYLLLFGGRGSCGTNRTCNLNDSWAFLHGRWSPLTTAVAPSVRYGAAMTADPATGGVLLFGGRIQTTYWSTTIYNDTWEFVGGRWGLVTSTGPPGSRHPQLATDATRGVLLLTGGRAVNSTSTWNYSNGTWTRIALQATPGDRGPWVYDPTLSGDLLFGANPSLFHAGAWSLRGVHPIPPGQNPESPYRTMVYDAGTSAVVLLIGTSTWSYSNGRWTDLTATISGHPTARVGAAMGYDAGDGAIILFSGISQKCANGGCGYYYLGDTWRLSKGSWTQLAPNPSPSFRFGSQLTWDATDGYLVLFGGSDNDLFTGACVCDYYNNDTWSFANGSWTNLTNAVHPSGRTMEGMTYDPVLSEVLLYGGYRCVRGYTCQALNDTWTFVGGTWTNRSSTAGGSLGITPGPRWDMAFAFDGNVNATVLFGGSSNANATWIFAAGHWQLLTFASPITPAPGRGVGTVYVPALRADLTLGVAGRSIWLLSFS